MTEKSKDFKNKVLGSSKLEEKGRNSFSQSLETDKDGFLSMFSKTPSINT